MRFQNYLTETTLSKETTKMIGNIKDPKLRSIAKKITSYKSNDKSLSLARVKTMNLIQKMVMNMGQAYDAGENFDIKKQLSKKEFKTVTDPFKEWFESYVTVMHKNIWTK